jgi:hypothetical protein
MPTSTGLPTAGEVWQRRSDKQVILVRVIAAAVGVHRENVGELFGEPVRRGFC